MKRRKSIENCGDGVERAIDNRRQPQIGPFPTAQRPNADYSLPNLSQFRVTSNGMPLGLPTYTSTDEFGRVYTPIMTYGPMPHSAPVPVATPPQIVQLAPTVSPIAFVPFVTDDESYLRKEK